MEFRTQPMVPSRRAEQEGNGMLPASAPLANPYVPYQSNSPQVYPAKQGVVRGTLFPGLDLPFCGMVNEEPLPDSHMHELQALGFALQELGEYLDTHPDNPEAEALMRSYGEMYRKCRDSYQRKHGPLTQLAASQAEGNAWQQDPWPWDYCQKEE